MIVFLLTLNASCSFLNSRSVTVLIDSDPTNAKIYIDEQYFGQTPKEISLVPDRSYQLHIVKDGHLPKSLTMETERSFREGTNYDSRDSKRCKLDRIGSILIIPFLAYDSVYCRNFTTNRYLLELNNNASENQSNQIPQGAPIPSSNHNYYLPATYQNINYNQVGNQVGNPNPVTNSANANYGRQYNYYNWSN